METSLAVIARYCMWLDAFCSPSTVKNRRYYASRLATWATEHHLDVFSLSELDISNWLTTLGPAPATRKNGYDVANSFFNWTIVAGLATRNPVIGVPRINVPPGVPRPTPQLVLDETLARCETLQDYLMVTLGYLAGLRASEIAPLHTNDVHDDHFRIRGKGKKVRLVPIHPAIAEILPLFPRGYYFPSRLNPTGHYRPDSIGQRIRRLSPQGWSAHPLRHKFATDFWEVRPDIMLLADVLGHQNISTTMIYARPPAVGGEVVHALSTSEQSEATRRRIVRVAAA